MRILTIVLGLLLLTSCNKKSEQSELEQFIAENKGRSEDFLIACAAGNMNNFMGSSERPVSVFFYNVDDATSAMLYVKSEEGGKDDFCYYSHAEEVPESMFNGRMGRFSISTEYNGKWVIVVYNTGETYNVSDPIFIRADTHPTVDITSKIVTQGTSTQPAFNWLGDFVKGNVIYFSLISNSNDDFVSGVYTTDRYWNFYDLSNVVLNVTPTINPTLNTQDAYTFTNMGVGKDNWVRTFGSVAF